MPNPAYALKSSDVTLHETRTLSHPLSDLHVLKNGNSFGIFNNAGDIEAEDFSPDGFFMDDTRLLSHWRISLEKGNLQVLNHSIDNYHILSTAHLACKGFTDQDGTVIGENNLYIRREKFLRQGTLYERINVENHDSKTAHIRLTLGFQADFYDIFQLRGMHRNLHGLQTDIHTDETSVEFRYTGMDGQVRTCLVRFSDPPTSLGAYRAEYDIRLERGQSQTFVVTAGRDPGESSNQAFDEVLQSIRNRIDRRLTSWTKIKTDNSRFDEWLEHSRIGIGLLTTLRQTGLYPYAGIPWFSTPFGRDGIITALQTLWLNSDIAKGVLTFLADTQATAYDDFRDAEPGKILHETREGEMSNTGEVPFGRYYGGIDTTFLFVILAEAYYEVTNDKAFLNKLWPSISAALSWMEKDGDIDGDGFYEYKCKQETGLYNQGWKDSHDSVFHADGTIAKTPIALCEVQAYAYAAYKAAASLARVVKGERPEEYESKAEYLYRRVNEVFWLEELGCYAIALDGDKKPCAIRSSNNGHMLWCGIVPEDRAKKITDMLMSKCFLTGWGIRTVATEAARYNPLSYHNGSIWPHDTAIAAAGMARYGFYDEAEQILAGLFKSTQDIYSYWLPELFGGFSQSTGHDLVRYPAACTLQAWACGAVFMALQAALGLEYDGKSNKFTAHNKNFSLLGKIEISQNGSEILRFSQDPLREKKSGPPGEREPESGTKEKGTGRETQPVT